MMTQTAVAARQPWRPAWAGSEPRQATPASSPADTSKGRAHVPCGVQETVASRVPSLVRAIIGDELRSPVAWCEAGACITRHSDPEALGEADIQARAITAGWRRDAFGRLTCPGCQQRHPFWSAQPVVPGSASRPNSAPVLRAESNADIPWARHLSVGRHSRTF